MKTLIEYKDGSKKVELDDGRTVTLSSPYSNGEIKISADNGVTGWLSPKYSNGEQTAILSDGTRYNVSERDFIITGRQDVWQKIQQKGLNNLTPAESAEATKTIEEASRLTSEENRKKDSLVQNNIRKLQQLEYEDAMHLFLLKQQEEEEEWEDYFDRLDEEDEEKRKADIERQREEDEYWWSTDDEDDEVEKEKEVDIKKKRPYNSLY